MKKRMIWILIFVILASSMTGCGAKSAHTEEIAYEMENQAAAEDITYEKFDSTENAEASGSGQPKEAQTSVSANRKLIQTVSLTVETDLYDELLPNLETKVNELGGYIENANSSKGGYYNSYDSQRTANMTIRIPQNKMAEFVEVVEGKSNVVSKSQTTEDVTLHYVDMEAHKKMLTTEQTRLLELLEKAESIEDILKIETRLSEIRYQIESMETQLRTYDNLVDYSTINLTIQEVKLYTQPQELGAWEKIRTGLVENIYHVKEGLKNFAVGFIIRIPYMIVWGVIILGLVFMIKLIRGIVRKRRKKATIMETTIDSKENSENKNE